MPTDFQLEYSPTESTICPYCHAPIPHENQAMRCAECDSVYHDGCWAELDKCAQFGCECTDARAVIYQAEMGNRDQNQWQSIPNVAAKARPIAEEQKRLSKLVPMPTKEEYGDMWRRLRNEPRNVWPTQKKIRSARAYYHAEGQHVHFTELLMFVPILTILSFGGCTAFVYKSLQVGSIAIALLCLVVPMLIMFGWLFLVMFIMIDRGQNKV